MAIKQTDLYSSLWSNCDELRGDIDACQFKGDPYGMMQKLPAGKTRLPLEKVKG